MLLDVSTLRGGLVVRARADVTQRAEPARGNERAPARGGVGVGGWGVGGGRAVGRGGGPRRKGR